MDLRVLSVAGVAFAMLSASANAGPIYKCLDAKGAVAYQQEPCPKSSTQAAHGYAAPVKAAPNLSWSAQSGALARQQRVREASYDLESSRAVPMAPTPTPIPVASAEPAPKRRNDQVTNTTSDLGTTKIDQYGRPYTKVAPNVLIDQRTSRPCITNGNNEIVSCQ